MTAAVWARGGRPGLAPARKSDLALYRLGHPGSLAPAGPESGPMAAPGHRTTGGKPGAASGRPPRLRYAATGTPAALCAADMVTRLP